MRIRGFAASPVGFGGAAVRDIDSSARQSHRTTEPNKHPNRAGKSDIPSNRHAISGANGCSNISRHGVSDIDGPGREYGDSFRNRDLVPEPDGHRDGDRVSDGHRDGDRVSDGHRDGDRVSDGDRDINAGTANDCHSNSRATDRHRFTRSTTNRNASPSPSPSADSVPCTRGGR